MRRIVLLILISIGITSTQLYAADTSKVEVRSSVNDGTNDVEDSGLVVKSFSTGARQQNTYSITTGVNTITVPTGAKGVMLDIPSASKNLHLIGRINETGISLDSTFPVILPISSDGAVVELRISNDSATTRTIYGYWL